MAVDRYAYACIRPFTFQRVICPAHSYARCYSPTHPPPPTHQFYPSPEFPILVYFKETQTKPEGQIHFFPVLASGLVDSFRKYVPLPGK